MAVESARDYKTIVTAVGKAKIAAAVQGSGKVNIVQAAVGDGGGAYYKPTADMTALIGEVWRGDIAGKWINEQSSNMADVKVILPADIGGFTVREAGLFDEDGDLIVICNMPDTEKAVITTGAAGTLTIVMHIVLTDVDVVEFKVDPLIDIVTAADVMRMIRQYKHTAQETSYDGSYENVQDALDALSARGDIKKEIVIPATGWSSGAEEAAEGDKYTDIALDEITEDMVPIVSIYPADMEIAKKSEMNSSCRTMKKVLRIYAKNEPTKEIHATLTLLLAGGASADGGVSFVLQPATKDCLGGVKIGNGVDVAADGTISVDGSELLNDRIATDEEAREIFDEVFSK